MTSANNNWRQGNNERRVNLAMTAEMALGGGTSLGQQKHANVNSGAIPRIRGDQKAGGNTDILESYMPSSYSKPTGATGSGNTYGFGSEKTGDTGNWQQPNRAYHTGNEFSGVGTGFGIGSGSSTGLGSQQKVVKDGFSSFGMNNNINNTNNNTSNALNGDSNGFKVQRVRGGANTGTTNTQQQPTGLGNIGQQSTQGIGVGLSKGVGRKDENTDIDFQTRQIKKEIDSLDQKLISKQHGGAEQAQSPSNAHKGNFGGQNNINTGINNGYGNPNNQIHGSSGFGSSSNNNNNNNFNNFNSPFDKPSLQSNGTASTSSTLNSQAPSSGSGQIRLPPKPSSKEGFEDPLAMVKKIPANPNAFASTSMSSKHIPSENNLAVAKEFSTGTYDPSNILGGSRQGRMRSLGRSKNEPANQHEEKAAQATGNKQLPEQQLVSMEQFVCPEGCGRSFNKNALEKHIPYCKKVFQQKKTAEKKPASGDVTGGKKENQGNGNEEQASKQPPKPPVKGKKDAKSTADNSAKIEALRKLKEQKKKEMEEMKKKEGNGAKDNDEDDVINDQQQGEFL